MIEVTLKTKDNVKIMANYYQNNFNSAVLIAPGWCMTKDSKAFIEIAEFFSNHFDVLSIDFRGHGKSDGFYTFSAKEDLDIEAAVQFLKNSTNDDGKNKYKNIYLLGFSLGAAAALIYVAKDSSITKVVAVSPPSEFNKIENQMWKKEAWGETFKKFELGRFLSIRPSIIPHSKTKPIDIVDKIAAPTLFIAGKKDPTVHFWHTVKLFEKAQCAKNLKLFDNGIHAEDIFLHFKEEFTGVCLEWLK